MNDIFEALFSLEYYDEIIKLIQLIILASGGIVVLVLTRSLNIRDDINRSPKLSLTFDKTSDSNLPYLEPVLAQGGEELWIRFSVINEGKSVAKNVQIKLDRLYKLSPDRQEKRTTYNGFGRWFKIANEDSIAADISPGDRQDYDIFFVKRLLGKQGRISVHMALVKRIPDLWRDSKRDMEGSEQSQEPGENFYVDGLVICNNSTLIKFTFDVIFPNKNIDKSVDKDRLAGVDILRKFIICNLTPYREENQKSNKPLIIQKLADLICSILIPFKLEQEKEGVQRVTPKSKPISLNS